MILSEITDETMSSFLTLVEDIVYEHKLPIPKEPGDMKDLAGGETIDLSFLTREHITSSTKKYPCGTTNLHSIDPYDTSEWRITYGINGMPKIDGVWQRKGKFKIMLSISEEMALQHIRVVYSNDEETVSYTSKANNIILPEWMKELALYTIRKSNQSSDGTEL